MKMLLLQLGCFIAVTFLAKSAPSCPDAVPLQFVSIIRAGGCPLTLYFPTDSSSIRAAYLAPAFCITQSMESVLRITPLLYDPISGNSFLSIPLTIASSRLLAEAQATLVPALQGRKLEFLQLLSAQQTGGLKLPVTASGNSNEETALIDLQCSMPDCFLRDATTTEISDALKKIELNVMVLEPDSGPARLKIRISLVNQARDLHALQSRQGTPSVLPAPICKYLKRHVTIAVDQSCTVTVLKRTDRKGHFVIEPPLCIMNGEDSGIDQLTSRPGVVKKKFTLHVKSERIKDIVSRNLTDLEPLSVMFMSVIGAEIQLSNAVQESDFESLRLTTDGDRVELQLFCDLSSSCKFYKFPDLWRHVSFTTESQLETGSRCSWLSSHRFQSPTRMESSLSHYHRIDGSLCLRSEFSLQYPTLQMEESCAAVCQTNTRCQAFSLVSNSCQLFVFDKCSRNLIDCSCDKRGPVFVKKRAGLQPGQLCPSGYENSRCEMKYKVFRQSVSWTMAKDKCESEKGLVTLSDLADTDEMSHVVSLKNRRGVGMLWLGGYQESGSSEPAGGWKWAGCDRPLASGLWQPGEPNNYVWSENPYGENATDLGSRGRVKLNDGPGHRHDIGVEGFLCKCVSPF